MGYGYGVWFKLDKENIDTISGHIPHVTVKCNMSYEEAIQLYHELVYRGLRTTTLHISREPVSFSKMYSNDLLTGWGYYVIMKPMEYLQCQLYSEKYKGDFSELPHITMQYNELDKQMKQVQRNVNKCLKTQEKMESDLAIVIDILSKSDSIKDKFKKIKKPRF